MMHYNCSSCGHPIGLMVNRNGEPASFICSRTGRLSQQVPLYREPRKTAALPKHLMPEDLSQRAKKTKKKNNAEII